MMRRTGFISAIALAAVALAAGAGAQAIDSPDTPRALASNGAVVLMPDITMLDCTEMSQTLRRIDQSNYRGPDPVPEGHPDWPIFQYEDRLTGAFYYDCTLKDHYLQDPSSAFSTGFEPQ